MTIPEINLKDYLYELPDDRIPNSPPLERSQSKLLVFNKGEISSVLFEGIVGQLPKEAHLVFNDTRVFPARMFFKRETGAQIEVFCLKSISLPKFDGQFWKMKWEVMVGNLKKWNVGEVLSHATSLTVELIKKDESGCIVEFSWIGESNFYEILSQVAELPLPPYMNRKATEFDKIRYQTVYAKHVGSVAAPTAGLHFTQEILEKIITKGHQISHITLHVGAGTFKPIKTDKIAEHQMHSESFTVKKDTIQHIINNDYVISVGTTSMRVLESLYWLGVSILHQNMGLDEIQISQWVGYRDDYGTNLQDSFAAILNQMELLELGEISGQTSIIIIPGYKFRVCKGLITNFHQPQSTLILLVAAFLGDNWRIVYDYALQNDFRFLSYGDSSILLP